MVVNRWWADDPRERFWLESTDRKDLGVDLRAPLEDDTGRDNWRYTLTRDARIGDLVFHYEKGPQAITAVSRVAGPPEEAPILWAARGTSARKRGAQPELVPGYRMPLDRHQKLASPINLERLRATKAELSALTRQLAGPRGDSIYFPFELSDREVRPLQGYAFKLPADFVGMFGALQAAAEEMGPDSAHTLSERELFRAIVDDMEREASRFAIAGLQAQRARRRGLKRVARRLFSSQVTADDWAFHHGGRNELQFNVGLDVMPDGSRGFRAGLAFSFEPSRSLPDIDIFLGRVERFNAWVREHPEDLADLSMWHWDGGARSPDYACGPIPQALVRNGIFVFVGDRQRLGGAGATSALRAFDRLLPLYEWVEEVNKAPEPTPDPKRPDVMDALRLDGGQEIDGGRWIVASIPERTLDIFLRHKEVQRRLKVELIAEGCRRVVTEAPFGQRRIDLVAEHSDGLWFYEVKIAATVQACLREAIGQLLEYALWPGATRPARLVVVGEHELAPTAASYLQTLNASFPIPLSYRQQRLDD